MLNLLKNIVILSLALSNTLVTETNKSTSVNPYPDDEFMSDITFTDSENSKSFSFFSESDNRNYLVINHEGFISVFDYDSGDLLTTAVLTDSSETNLEDHAVRINEIDVPLRDSPDDYELWSYWSYVTTQSLHIDNITGTTISIIISIIYSAWQINVGYAVAQCIYNQQYSDITGQIYYKSNVYCPILKYTRYYLYSSSGAYIGFEDYGPTWFGNAYDYDQPYACRVLAQRY